LAKIKHKINNSVNFEPFELGNINARRDWSYSNDFIEAIWIMLHQNKPDEYILSSNKDYSIKDFINMCCKSLGLSYEWEIDEDPLNTKMYINNKLAITINEKYYRPSEIFVMRGDSMETYKKLNWKPKTSLQTMINIMCEHDYKLLSNKDVN
jgi:GDPmannose 4,6-dehydratase